VAVTFPTSPDGNAVVRHRSFLDDVVVEAEGLSHDVGGVLPEACASLDVGEQKRDDTIGKLGHERGE